MSEIGGCRSIYGCGDKDGKFAPEIRSLAKVNMYENLKVLHEF